MGSECGVEVCKMLEKKLSAEGGSIDPADILGHCIGNAMNKVYYIYIMFSVCLWYLSRPKERCMVAQNYEELFPKIWNFFPRVTKIFGFQGFKGSEPKQFFLPVLD